MAARYWMDEGDGWVHTDPAGGLPVNHGWREIIPVVVGSAEWGIVMSYRGVTVADRNGKKLVFPTAASIGCTDDGWHLLPPAPPPKSTLDPVPEEVHERGWQWRPVGDGAFAPPFGTIRVCVDCGCLVAGGPTRCVRCVREMEKEERIQAKAPPPIRKGERVRWWRGEDSGTGTYVRHTCPIDGPAGEHVCIGGCSPDVWVERVEVL